MVDRILHVAESFGGGVSAAILDYVDSVPELQHDLLYSVRSDAPISRSIVDRFNTATEFPVGHFARVRSIRSLVKAGNYRSVHAHSSIAGAYVRLATSKRRVDIIYTPHCYAFERADLIWPLSPVFRLIEHLLALNTTKFAACSLREEELSRWRGCAASTIFVPNVVSDGLGDNLSRVGSRSTSTYRLVGAGRASPQKDPDFFFECVDTARAAGIDLDAVWVGGDDDLATRGALHGVRVTGWLPRDESLEQLASADLYLHSAAWEGFPIAVLEALALNVPTLVREIPAFENVGIPGLLTSQDFVSKILRIQSEDDLRDILEQGQKAVSGNTKIHQRQALIKLYELDSM